ncbi:hypothetical protein Pfo_015290 [Paulownia fortunei]|nr:hypothetical protein Pfo_015290 [Paulownia fortunei]
MAGSGSVEGAGFWLPTEFLTDDDFLMDKENFNKSNNTESGSEFCFPTEFPYDFETEGNQRLEKLWVMSTSPQSTLAYLGSWTARSAGGSSNGSPNGVPSPPATPLGAKYDAVGDLIYRAAGQVAKLKLNRGDGLGPGPTKDKGLLGPPRSVALFYPEAKNPNPSVFPNTHFQQKQQNESCGVWYSQQKVYENRGGRTVGGMGQAAWTLQQNPTRGRAVLLGGSGGGGGGGATAKRACAGTGVFLPRRYGNNNDSNGYSSDSRKKPGCPTALFPRRAAVHAHTKNFNNLNGFAQPQPQSQPRFNAGFIPDYSMYPLMVRRHEVLLQQRRSLLTSLAERSSMMTSRDLFLPQEWNY